MGFSNKLSKWVVKTHRRMRRHPIYRTLTDILGVFTLLPAQLLLMRSGDNNASQQQLVVERKRLIDDGSYNAIYQESLSMAQNKASYFGIANSSRVEKEAQQRTDRVINERINAALAEQNRSVDKRDCFYNTLQTLLNNPVAAIASLILSFPMYLILLLFAQPYIKYITERVLMMIFVLLGIVVVVFSIIYVAPNDPARSVLGQEATPEAIESFNRSYDLNEPYIVQLANYVKKLATFDLGRSYIGSEDVSAAITRKMPVTLYFGAGAMLICIIIAMPAGIISAVRQYSLSDYLLMFIALLGLSIPNFWLGLILILNFSLKLGWLPPSYVVGNWVSLIMPAIVLGTGMSAQLARMTRASMLEVMTSDYVRTARAKGLREGKVIFRHVLKNAMIPIVTVMGMQVAGVFSGAANTEKVFTIAGIGTYTTLATMTPDTPVIISTVVYMSAISSAAILLLDILYTFIDPRLKTRLKEY